MLEPPLNAMTVDLEDWPQSVLDPRLPITDCVVRNTERVLGLLDRFGVRATFFALGKVCERHPQLLPSVLSAGHEIGSHGYGHELVHRLTPEQFRNDVRQSADIIAGQIGVRPIGYRAPAFSVTRATPWVGPILCDLGFRYSSSVFPFAGRRYGTPDAPRGIHAWDGCDLLEFPMTTVRRFGRNLPISGGGYFRLVPGRLIEAAFREVNAEGRPAVVYVHPYELAAVELADLTRQGWRIRRSIRFRQSLFRGRVGARLARLWRRFRFGTMAEALGLDRSRTDPPCVRAARDVLRAAPTRIGETPDALAPANTPA